MISKMHPGKQCPHPRPDLKAISCIRIVLQKKKIADSLPTNIDPKETQNSCSSSESIDRLEPEESGLLALLHPSHFSFRLISLVLFLLFYILLLLIVSKA